MIKIVVLLVVVRVEIALTAAIVRAIGSGSRIAAVLSFWHTFS